LKEQTTDILLLAEAMAPRCWPGRRRRASSQDNGAAPLIGRLPVEPPAGTGLLISFLLKDLIVFYFSIKERIAFYFLFRDSITFSSLFKDLCVNILILN
jgi:hypothetical protein